MANFEIAMQHIKKSQGLYPYYSGSDRLEGDNLLCSDCFQDEGLRLNAYRIGIQSNDKCLNCPSKNGRKLTKQIIRELCYIFFVRGTTLRFNYGGAPIVQMNEERFNDSDIKVPASLEGDLKLLEQAGKIGFFYYGPRLWMLGEIEPLKNLQKEEEMDKVIDRILELYPKHLVHNDHPFYRVRVNPEMPFETAEYDSPPTSLTCKNRLNWGGEAILYGSPDLELCIHECRATAEDDLYVAKMVPLKSLRLFNLAAVVTEEGLDEFSRIDMAVHFLFLAGTHSYPICTRISQRIQKEGYDGIIYPSYFSHTRTGTMPFETILGMSTRYLPPLKARVEAETALNVALFGWPVKEGKIKVHSINKIIINSIKYDLSFGPADIGSEIDKTKREEFIQKRHRQEEEKVLKAFGKNS